MPSARQTGYAVAPGQHIEVLVEQQDGGRAMVAGTLTGVPVAAWGGQAWRIKVAAERIMALPAEKRRGSGKRRGRKP
jgi:hypothetical protein